MPPPYQMAASIQIRPRERRDLWMVLREVDENLAIFLGNTYIDDKSKNEQALIQDSYEFGGSKVKNRESVKDEAQISDREFVPPKSKPAKNPSSSPKRRPSPTGERKSTPTERWPTKSNPPGAVATSAPPKATSSATTSSSIKTRTRRSSTQITKMPLPGRRKSCVAHDDDDDVSPVVMGTKMVERLVNMRKLAPPPRGGEGFGSLDNRAKKKCSTESTAFGRSLSNRSLDMAIRHMDIRRSITTTDVLRAVKTTGFSAS